MNNDKIILLPQRLALWIGILGATFYGVLAVFGILRSTNSTASIGFVILPFAVIIIFMVFAFFGYWFGMLIRGLLKHNSITKIQFFLALLIVIPTSTYLITQGEEVYFTYRAVNQINQMNSEELNLAFNKRPMHTLYGYDIFILAAIANNHSTSSVLLDKIAHLNDPRIYNPLGSIYHLNSGNKEGLSVIRLLAHNPNVSLNTLVYMSHLSDPNVLGDLASNPKLPDNILRELYSKSQHSKEGYLIEWGLAYNPNTPPDILRELAKKIRYDKVFDPIKSALIRNPNTPSDLKTELTK